MRNFGSGSFVKVVLFHLVLHQIIGDPLERTTHQIIGDPFAMGKNNFHGLDSVMIY